MKRRTSSYGKISLFLLASLMLSLQAHGEQARIATCETYDPPPSQTDQQEFADRKKVSGLVVEPGAEAEQTIQFLAANMSATDAQSKVLGREWADLINARILDQRTVGSSICAVAEGDVAYRGRITPEFFPAPDPQPVAADALKSERFFIPVLTAGILEGSLWTEGQIRQRFQKIRKVYGQCGVDFDSLNVRTIPNPDHKYDNIDDDMEPRDSRFLITPFEKRMAEMLAPTHIQAPAILYIKNVWPMDVVKKLGKNCTAEARAFIPEKIVPKDSPIAGMALIVDAYSSVQGGEGCPAMHQPTAYRTDAHELGHLLLSDGGHSPDHDNLMFGFASETEGILDETQCAKIRASPFVHRTPR